MKNLILTVAVSLASTFVMAFTMAARMKVDVIDLEPSRPLALAVITPKIEAPKVELIVKNQDKWDHELWDDVALSKVMQELNIDPIDVKRFNIEGNIFGQEIDLENYQFRCRADTHFNYPRYIEAHLLKIIYKLVNKIHIHPIQRTFYYYYFEILKTVYIKEFSWKLYLKIRKLLKRTLPTMVYNKIKTIFSKKIIKFQYKRFKY